MTSQPSLDPRLFVDYLAGACTPAECVEVEQWAAADPHRGEVLDDLRTMWLTIPGRTKLSVDLDAFVHRVEARIAASTESHYDSRVARPAIPRRTWYATTGLALGILALLIGWKHGIAIPHLGTRTSVAMATYTTTNGERANITLMDGTTVALDVASRLDVPADYPTGNHTLHLTGEALFTVTHHEGAPFTVLTGSARTQVLGTSFVVRHYPSDIATTVVVRDGKVAVRSAAVPSTVVTAAQQAEITQTGLIHVQPADPAQFAFATGLLKLDRVLLPTAIPELNRWYDVDIQLGAPTLATQRVTGEFAAGSLADLSDILSLMFNVRVVRDGRVLTLYPR